MCIIIDTNVAGIVFSETASNYEAVEFLRGRLESGSINPVFSRGLMGELENSECFKIWWRDKQRSGKLSELTSEELDDIESLGRRLKRAKKLESNDHDIIALATIAKATILCTKDNKLKSDYKKLKVGVIYPMRDKKPSRYRKILDDYGKCPRFNQKTI